MPGPSNGQRKRKSNTGKGQKHATARKSVGGSSPAQASPNSSCSVDSLEASPHAHCDSSSPSSPSPTGHLLTPSPQPPFNALHHHPETHTPAWLATDDTITPSSYASYQSPGMEYRIPSPNCRPQDTILPQIPFLHDPGNGIRVRDARAFLDSSFFSQPPSLDDPLCAEFAQEEVLQMLSTVLPEDLALILWYNKSRASSRVCPACQRLYRIGDTLPDLISTEEGVADEPKSSPPPQVGVEQGISGICSAICFIVASFSHPGAIKSAWGRMADDMDDASWELLNSPPKTTSQGELGANLALIVRMTRLHDLGLGQLCLPDIEFSDEHQ
ncbi:hypothetical protein HGRIS_006986 [Hohenbuehelia grisea]|uniref:Uncharacterized protein n=1 Tax=Hohenbuehelia grisea TaxID=104357 RepID=A0ABR3JB98_9AGAR